MNTADLRISPFQNFLRVELVRADNGSVVIRMPDRSELQRVPGSNQLHGGVVGALIDIAGSYAVELKTGSDAPTVDLRIDYLRSAASELIATAAVIKHGKTLCVADVEVRDEQKRLVAVGRGTFMNTTGNHSLQKG